MAKYVRNDSGTVHSVDDSFTVPEGWDEIAEATARTEYPELVGDAPAEEAPAVEDEVAA